MVTRSREGDAPAGAGSLGLAAAPSLRVPQGAPGGLLRGVAVRTFNAALWHRSPRRDARASRWGPPSSCSRWTASADWNRLYGRRGLLQYQFAVPRG